MKNKNVNIVPIVSYNNIDVNKYKIYKENNMKSGIYRWNNLISGKSYVGLSKNLTGRFRTYYSKKAMLSKLSTSKSIIYSAILKHDYANFNLEIVEYCEIDVLTEREQYYIDILKPEYNILKVANSRLGSNHSLESQILVSIKQKGIDNPSFGMIHSDHTRMKISESLKSKFITNETKLRMSFRTRGVKVKVFDLENNLIKEFPTIISVALHFNINSRTVSRYLDKNTYYNGYIFKRNLL